MRMNRSATRVIVVTLVAILALGIVTPMASYAGRDGRRNTAILLTLGALIALSNVNDRDHRHFRDRNDQYFYSRDRNDRYFRDRNDQYFYSRDRNDRYFRDGNDRYFQDRDRDRNRDRDDRRDKKHSDRGNHRGWDKDRDHNRW